MLKAVQLDGICIDGYEYKAFKWRFMTDEWWSSFFGLINQYAGSINLGLSFKEYLEEKQSNAWRSWYNASAFVRDHDSCVMSIANCLKNIMSGRTDLELVNCALKFVQSIEYAYDIEQYRSDDYFAFPAETLWSQKGDCDDHAILFASIVKAMGFDVVLFDVNTPDGGHMAAGVNVDGASGTKFLCEGKYYWYCEATAMVGNYYGNQMNVGDMPSKCTVLETVPIH